MDESNFVKKHIKIFLLLIPYYILCRVFSGLISFLFSESIAGSDIPYIYIQSFIFDIPIFCYLLLIIKNLFDKRFFRSLIFSIIMIILLCFFYFSGIIEANKVINKTYQLYKEKDNYSSGYKDEKIGVSEAFELYFAPWIIERKIYIRYVKWVDSGTKEPPMTPQEKNELDKEKKDYDEFEKKSIEKMTPQEKNEFEFEKEKSDEFEKKSNKESEKFKKIEQELKDKNEL